MIGAAVCQRRYLTHVYVLCYVYAIQYHVMDWYCISGAGWGQRPQGALAKKNKISGAYHSSHIQIKSSSLLTGVEASACTYGNCQGVVFYWGARGRTSANGVGFGSVLSKLRWAWSIQLRSFNDDGHSIIHRYALFSGWNQFGYICVH